MLLNHVAEKFVDEHGIDPRDDPEAYQDLVIKTEEAKKALSKKPVSKIFAQCGGKSLKLSVSREEVEELTLPRREQTETYLDVVLKKADLGWADIDVVIEVGGSTRMPAVQGMLRRVTEKEAEKGVNQDECVAIGASYWAAILMVRQATEAKEAAVSTEASDEVRVSAQQAVVAVEEAVPEEIVGMLGGMVVQNVNSHSLGIVTVRRDGNRQNLIMIPEQTPLPAEVTKVFGTYMENQLSVEIRILEGESEDPDECTEIGTCVISDLPPNRPKGSKVSVTYRYAEDGRIEIIAHDRETGVEARTEIRREGEGLSEEEMSQKGEEIARLLEVGPEEAYAGGYEDQGYAEGGDAYADQGYAEGGDAYADQGYAEGGDAYADQGYAEGGEAYAEGGEGYAEGGEAYADAGYAEGGEAYADAGYAEGGEGYADAGYAEGGEGYAEGGEGYAEGGEGYADAGYAEGGEGYADAGYAEGGEGYADAGYAEGGEGYADAGYAEGGEGYAEGGEGYAEGGEGYAEGGEGYADQDYAEGGEGYAEEGYAEGGEGYEQGYAEGAYADGYEEGYGDEGFSDSAER
jgi:hypothetical protein